MANHNILPEKTKTPVIDTVPRLVRSYALYLRNVKGLSNKTVDEYCLDLRTFFRFMKSHKNLVSKTIDFTDIHVTDIEEEFILKISTLDIYEFMNFVADEKNNMASTRQRKTSSIQGFFKYITIHEHIIKENPAAVLTPPKKRKTVAKHLTLDQARELLLAVDGTYKERDFCIITIFLNCGIRLSELVGINFNDINRNEHTLKIVGKGNKERIVYLNSSCIEAIDAYLLTRPVDGVIDKNAVFLSKRLQRISPKTVQYLVNFYLDKIGLGGPGMSVHKLRHTAATLMHQNNVDIRVLQEVLGHENLGTTEIYTHVSNKKIEEAIESNPLANFKKSN